MAKEKYTCNDCGIEKDKSEFYTDLRNISNIKGTCKICTYAMIKYKLNTDSKFREKYKNYQKKYHNNRYNLDVDFRKKMILSSKKSSEKKDNGFKNLKDSEQLDLMNNFMSDGLKKLRTGEKE